MLKLFRILVIAHALVGGAAVLSACGQKGSLVLPTTPESAGRATLPQTLNPSSLLRHTPVSTSLPSLPASSPTSPATRP